jgi:flagellar biosynthetic protein FliP
MKKGLLIIVFLSCFLSIYPQERVTIPIPKIDLNITEATTPNEISLSLQILLLLSILTLSPSIIILATSFLRISIVLHFVKQALSLQQMPPSQVIFGLALFLTFFIMWPTFDRINNEAIQPFINQETLPPNERINMDQFWEKSIEPIREFMLKQTDPKYIGFFMKLRGLPTPNTYKDVPTFVLLPAFVVNEMTVAFKMGVLIFIPFVVIDLVIASSLMAMGMIMLPPVMISLPFKILLFVWLDGWELLIYQVFRSFF